MSFCVNDTSLEEITFNGEQVKAVYYNHNLVWGGPVFPPIDVMTWEDIYNVCKAKQSGEIEEWPEDFKLGATIPITFSEPIDKDNRINAMIIGIDIDGPGTITFQTETCLGRHYNHWGYRYYSKSGEYSPDPQTDAVCQTFYERCGLKDYIKPVLKGTCIPPILSNECNRTPIGQFNTPGERNAAVTYAEYYVWVPSEFEVGLDKYSRLSTANSTPTNAECTYGVCQPYPYYDSDEKRKKQYYSYNYWTDEKSTELGGCAWQSRSLSWQRSKVEGYHYHCYVDVGGEAQCRSLEDGGGSGAIAPAFVIG